MKMKTCAHVWTMTECTYCTPELEVAINMGYTIIQIHEVLHWKETEMYNPVTKQGGLFTQYINTFLKLKQESSGYPLSGGTRLGVTGVIDVGIQGLQVIQTMFTEAFMQRLHCNPCILTSITPVTPNLVPPLGVH